MYQPRPERDKHSNLLYRFTIKMHISRNTALLSILICLGGFSVPANARTIQTEQCDIYGDPDVYGPGVRYGFYLQWGALIIFLLAAPDRADIARAANSITTFAVYVNVFRSLHEHSLVTVDWPLLWYITSALSFWNIPVSENGAKKSGGPIFINFIIYSMYYMASPWVFFKAWVYGRQPGCQIKYFLFRPINVYSHGFWTFLKVSGTFGAITVGPLFFVLAWFALGAYFSGWGDGAVREHQEEPNAKSAALGIFTLGSGAFAIAFAEMTIKTNNITFPDTHITDSGQFIPLLIGVFSLVSAIFSALHSFGDHI